VVSSARRGRRSAVGARATPALLLPYALAGITLAGWGLAGVLWGIVWPLLAGTFSPTRSARLVFGITGIGGLVTTAFVFFASEHRWRNVLPAFFADGDLSAVRGAPRLGVRLRLLVVFLLISLVPLSLLGVLSYTSATELLGADRAAAERIVAGLVPVILFVVAVGVASSIGLATFVASSVARPLAEVEHAMVEVGRGNLDHRCTVVANDEIGALAEGFNRMVQGLRERDRIKETFGKYVTPEIRDEILASRVALEGQALEATILFADLRDFTSWVQRRTRLQGCTDFVGDSNPPLRQIQSQLIKSEWRRGGASPPRNHCNRATATSIPLCIETDKGENEEE
jgi:adenylate cyclase